MSHIEYWHFTRPLAVVGVAAFVGVVITMAINSFDGDIPRWVPWSIAVVGVVCFAAIEAIAP